MAEMRNDREVYNVLNNVIRDALDATAGYVLGVIESYVMKDVYGSGNIPHMYQRTNEFFNSWVKEVESSNRLDEVVATIFSDVDLMHYDPSNHIHGSYLSGDFREHMAEVIEEGLGYKYFPQTRKDGTQNPAGKPRRFFSHTINELNKSGQLKKIFEMEMKARGINIMRKNDVISSSFNLL